MTWKCETLTGMSKDNFLFNLNHNWLMSNVHRYRTAISIQECLRIDQPGISGAAILKIQKSNTIVYKISETPQKPDQVSQQLNTATLRVRFLAGQHS